MEDGKKLGTRVDAKPEPDYVVRAAQPGAQFIALDMREPEIGEETFVQGLCVRQPAHEGVHR